MQSNQTHLVLLWIKWRWPITLLTLVVGLLAVLLFKPLQSVFAHRHEPEFKLRSETTLTDEQAQILLRLMSELQSEIQWQFDLPMRSQMVDVSLFSDQGSYLEFVTRHFPDAADRSALFIKRSHSGTVVLHQNPEMLNDLRHECTHAVLHKSLNQIPLWLDEGIAEYFEQPAELRENGNPWWGQAEELIRRGWIPNLQRLEQLQNLSEMTNAEYCESWLWVHFLIHGPTEVHGALNQYLQQLQTKTKPPDFSHFASESGLDLDSLLRQHLLEHPTFSETTVENHPRLSSEVLGRSSLSLDQLDQ